MSWRGWTSVGLSGTIGFASVGLAIQPQPILQALSWVLVLGFLGAQAMLLGRGYWVFRQRQKLIANIKTQADMDAYKRLPDWGVMMQRWWIWRIEDFQK